MKPKQDQFPNITRALRKGWAMTVIKRFDDTIQATIAGPGILAAEASHAVGDTPEVAMRRLDHFLMETAL